MNLTLKYFRLHIDAPAPVFATDGSACFDLCAFWPSPYGQGAAMVEAYSDVNNHQYVVPDKEMNLFPGWRYLIPTGLILDIPKGYSVRLHSRSGLSLKMGIVLANSEGVIDEDYYHETFIMVQNTSQQNLKIANKSRLCQGELVKKLEYNLHETIEKPGQTTNRVGGLGSTGYGGTLPQELSILP